MRVWLDRRAGGGDELPNDFWGEEVQPSGPSIEKVLGKFSQIRESLVPQGIWTRKQRPKEIGGAEVQFGPAKFPTGQGLPGSTDSVYLEKEPNANRKITKIQLDSVQMPWAI